MKTEEEIIKDLEAQGYNPVYVWNAEPNEDDPEHGHEFDTKLHILSGGIRIKVLNGDRIDDYQLAAGSELEIARNQRHSAVVGPDGCKYVVAERH
jgi:hypothetical protein